ncbi:MAG: SsrA-binding protein SmpB [Candidatus Aminicenantes bacterium]|nr:SsrA-binding protein SmpB [Candidatus Aminicenantes bacterium]
MRVVAKNKKAFFNYDIVDTYEAGISLTGSEVKSIREGKISIKESYVTIKDGEVFLINCHISHYEAANLLNHKTRRDRKLLLHRQEIKRLTGKIKQKGLTIIPTKVVINERGLIKVQISLAKGKRLYEKRETIKERDRERDMRAQLKRYQK